MSETKAIHIGDGAYASIDQYGDLVITANHHDQHKASDAVVIERGSVQRLVEFIADHFKAAP